MRRAPLAPLTHSRLSPRPTDSASLCLSSCLGSSNTEKCANDVCISTHIAHIPMHAPTHDWRHPSACPLHCPPPDAIHNGNREGNSGKSGLDSTGPSTGMCAVLSGHVTSKGRPRRKSWRNPMPRFATTTDSLLPAACQCCMHAPAQLLLVCFNRTD